MFDGDQLVAVLDFEEVCYEPVSYSLSSTDSN